MRRRSLGGPQAFSHGVLRFDVAPQLGERDAEAKIVPDLRVDVAASLGQPDGFTMDGDGIGESPVCAKRPAKQGEGIAIVGVGLATIGAHDRNSLPQLDESGTGQRRVEQRVTPARPRTRFEQRSCSSRAIA